MNNFKKFASSLFTIILLCLLFATKCHSATSTTTISSLGDTFVSSKLNVTNFSTNEYLFLGQDVTHERMRSYFKVNLDEFNIPADKIEKVTLNLYQISYSGTNPYTVILTIPRESWTLETVKFLNQPASLKAATFENISIENGWKSFDITSMFKNWITVGGTDMGFMFKLLYDTDPYVMYWSCDCNIVGCPADQQPHITVYYHTNTPPIPGEELIPANESTLSPGLIEFSINGSIDEENQKLLYTLEISKDNFFTTQSTFGPQENNIFPEITLNEPGEYQWRVKITDEEDAEAYSKTNKIFIIENTEENNEGIDNNQDGSNGEDEENNQSPENKNETEDIKETPDPQEPPANDEKNNQAGTKKEITTTQTNKVINTQEQKVSSAQTITDTNEKTEKEKSPGSIAPSVLGTSTSSIASSKCIVYYYSNKGTFKTVSCKASPPTISKAWVTKNSSSKYTVEIIGTVAPKRNITYTYYRCKRKTISDPRTYVACIYEKYKKIDTLALTKNYLTVNLDQKFTITERTIDRNGNYKITITTSQNPAGKYLTVSTKQTLSDTATGKRFTLTQKSGPSLKYKLPNAQTKTVTLSNFFTKIIGVTQWYGKTAYSKFHTGIDFGATKEKIYSPENGTVVYKGWDNYYGECLSGGIVLKIKHSEKLYSVYMHLLRTSSDIKVGDTVKKGQYIGTSGNTGAYNCQKLAYHLHFEIRTGSSMASHTNPVPILNINWDKVPTLGYKQYPGRLTGQNPHPTY